MTFPLFSFHLSKWWRGPVQVEKGVITPVQEKLQPYNPFDLYFPHGRRARKTQNPSLYFRFLEVNTNDSEAVVDFCKRFGILGRTDVRGWDSWIRVSSPFTKSLFDALPPVPKNDMEAEGKKYYEDKFYQSFGGDAPNPRLITTMTIEEFQAAQRQFRAVVTWSQEARQGPKLEQLSYPEELKYLRGEGATFEELAYFSVTDRLRLYLSMVRPYSEWDPQEGRWAIGWDFGSLLSAMYLMFMLDLQGAGTILQCPWCHKNFLGEHSRTAYCSPGCQNSAKVARYRNKVSQKKSRRMLKNPENVPKRKRKR